MDETPVEAPEQPQDEGTPLFPMPPGAGDFQMPSLEQLLTMLDRMKGIPEEEKEDLRRQLLERNSLGAGDPVAGLQQTQPALTTEAMLAIVGVVLFLSLFVFFGYKLYKSLKDKEKKRDEKRKMKQQKKKK